MSEGKLEKSIKEKVLAKIQTGAIRSRPKTFFVIRLILAVLLGIIALAVSVFVIGFIFFSIHESGEQFLLGFGGSGVLTFISLFPWTLLLLDIIVLVLLEWLLESFKLAWRVSLLSVFLVIFSVSSVLGFVSNFTPLHNSLLKMADEGNLPILGQTYESIHNSHASSGIFRGRISVTGNGKIVITHDDHDKDADDGTRTVILPAGSPPFRIGQRVYVFGSPASGTSVVEARQVRGFPDNY